MGEIFHDRRAKKRGLLARLFGGRSSGDADREWLDATLAVIWEPAFVLDESDRIHKMNTAAEHFLGRPPEGRSLAALLGSSDMISLLKRWRGKPEGEKIVPEEIFLRRAPSPDVWMEVTAAPMMNSGGEERTDLLLVIMRDITRRKQLEALRRDFVANVSHDLRTPVTILKGYAETLNDDFDQLSDSERKRFVERIHKNTGRLNRLLEDMLQLAILENGGVSLNLQKGTLHNTIRDAVDALADRLTRAGVGTKFEFAADDTEVAVDAAKVMRIMFNLLENALRHASGMTCIRISTTNDKEGGITVSVADDGVGLAQADMVRMFERFFRADKSRTGEKGTGLGLSIVKHLMGLHGGTVLAVPNRPRGLVIQMNFPNAPVIRGEIADGARD